MQGFTTITTGGRNSSSWLRLLPGRFDKLPGISVLNLLIVRIICLSCRRRNEIYHLSRPGQMGGSDGWICPYDEPRLTPRNRFLRHCADLPPSAPDFVTAMGVLTDLSQLGTSESAALAIGACV